MDKNSLLDLFEKAVHAFGPQPLFWQWQEGVFSPITYQETSQHVHGYANGWKNSGLNRGEKVALWLDSSPLWVITEISIWYAGGVAVPMNLKTEINTLIWQIKHAECQHLVLEEHLVEQILPHLPALPENLHLWYNRKNQRFEHPQITPLQELLDFGDQVPLIPTTDLAAIIFTSGTSADPRAVLLSHENLRTNVLQIKKRIPIPPEARTFMLLPLDHAFAHTVGLYSVIIQGGSIGFPPQGKSMMEILRMIPEILQSFQPDFLLLVPALIKSLRLYVERAVRSLGEEVEKDYRNALALAYQKARSGDELGYVKRLSAFFMTHAVLNKLKDKLFPNLKFMVTGGAYLDRNVIFYFNALGLPVYQGYGLTEASPVVSTNNEQYQKVGSVGMPLSMIEVEIRDEKGERLPLEKTGEIVVKGTNVTRGYFKNTEATNLLIRDKWLHTGDIGKIDSEGYLYVLGRIKSLLISSDGEKFPPEMVEADIEEFCSCIDAVCLYNNQSPYTLALVVPNVANIRKKALEKHIGNKELIPFTLKTIEEELINFRKATAFEAKWPPNRFRLMMEPMSIQNRFLNHNYKMIRPRVHDFYAAEIEEIFRKKDRNTNDPINLERASNLHVSH
ncbi:long-chain fatty acid--CoA ligase [Persicobacter sp. CCB-QB2]|uniref:AMP-dependent synthetase/ligase n=1 Tax=Persicobacter sp. CCB-QB2 TaxID=1561025 RepID=UPI000B136AFD|nr:AMP-binding protein [Persicobacter sp. CCB-QB2]